ncbi:MAG: PhoH family protein [Chitinophagales bacterium]|nr:PhoH family protein [Chitinophagales bacterium]
MNELTINIEQVNPIDFFGVNNSKLNLVKKKFPLLKIVSRGTKLKAAGSEEELALFEAKVKVLLNYLEKYGKLGAKEIDELLGDEDKVNESLPADNSNIIVYGNNGNIVRARTANQKRMVEISDQNDIVFAVGPAGTGKTYTAVALAVKALKEKQVKRIILTRPAVEAGESLGFLPGDLKEKIDPYLRPLYDGLYDMIPGEKLSYYFENRVIEVAPLAFMRGRTLDKAFIILDEAQNTTVSQLKMFLTRIGPSAKCIITGDMSQIDLPKHQKSGLSVAINLLKNIKGIGHVELTTKDVIRHPLVGKIITAFDKYAE